MRNQPWHFCQCVQQSPEPARWYGCRRNRNGECKHTGLQAITITLKLLQSSISFPSVGLCFSAFFLRLGTTCSTGGLPICSRAMALTASTALNRFTFFFFFAMMFSIVECNAKFPRDCAGSA